MVLGSLGDVEDGFCRHGNGTGGPAGGGIQSRMFWKCFEGSLGYLRGLLKTLHGLYKDPSELLQSSFKTLWVIYLQFPGTRKKLQEVFFFGFCSVFRTAFSQIQADIEEPKLEKLANLIQT